MQLSEAESRTPSSTAHIGEETLAIAPVEVKARIFEDSLSSVLSCQTADLLCFNANSEHFRKRIPATGTLSNIAPMLCARLPLLSLCVLF